MVRIGQPFTIMNVCLRCSIEQPSHGSLSTQPLRRITLQFQTVGDPFDPAYLYRTGSWWPVVHNLMQALTVLLLEISYDTVHFPDNGKEILSFIKKLIRWLRIMKENDQLAESAYTMAFRLVRRVASQVNMDISDLLREEVTSYAAPKRSTFEDLVMTNESR